MNIGKTTEIPKTWSCQCLHFATVQAGHPAAPRHVTLLDWTRKVRQTTPEDEARRADKSQHFFVDEIHYPLVKHTKNYGKSPCYQWVNPCKSTISMAIFHHFSIANC